MWGEALRGAVQTAVFEPAKAGGQPSSIHWQSGTVPDSSAGVEAPSLPFN